MTSRVSGALIPCPPSPGDGPLPRVPANRGSATRSDAALALYQKQLVSTSGLFHLDGPGDVLSLELRLQFSPLAVKKLPQRLAHRVTLVSEPSRLDRRLQFLRQRVR